MSESCRYTDNPGYEVHGSLPPIFYLLGGVRLFEDFLGEIIHLKKHPEYLLSTALSKGRRK